MRKLVCQKRDLVVVFVWCLVVVVDSVLSSDTSLNNTQIADGNGTLSSGRNSRQLWSLVKNVIKTGLEQNSGNGNNVGSSSAGNGVGGGLGTLASLFGSAIASGINSDGPGSSSLSQYGNQYYPQNQGYHPPGANLSPNQFNSPNDYMHYVLLNQGSNQHTSLPHYAQQQQQREQESAADLIEKYKEQVTAGSENTETAANTGSQILNKLALGTIFEDLDKVTNLLNIGNMENVMSRINRFDKLKCIPRMLCQMVSKRNEDQKKEEEKKKAKEREDNATKKPVNRKADDDEEEEDEDSKKSRMEEDAKESDKEVVKKDKKKQNEKKKEENDKKDSGEDENDDDDEEEDEEEEEEEDDDESDEAKEYVVIKEGAEDKNGKEDKVPQGKGRTGRFLKLNGSDVALEQFVKFLELMQLKDWSLYPYLNGAYQGHQVSRTEECAYRFSSCPFSDDQLVYYFNNYNGGFFQSI